MSGGYWETVNFYCTQGIRQSLSWLKMELIGHQLEVLTAWASLQLWHFDDNQGRSITFGATTLSEFLLSHQCSPSPRDTGWAEQTSCVRRPACWSFQTRHHQSPGTGPTPACFLSQRVLANCQGGIRGHADWQDLIWGKQGQIWTCPKAGLDRPQQMVL